MDFQALKEIMGIGILIAYVAVGIIEWIKKGIELFSQKKEEIKIKDIIPWVLLPVSCFLASFFFDGGIWNVLSRGGIAWSTAQLAYPIIIKIPNIIYDWIKKKIEDLTNKGA
jgi:hypothetical protein